MNKYSLLILTIVFVISLISIVYIAQHLIFMKKVYKTKINILTRSGKRENCFKLLRKSIEKQSFKNWKHLISNDNIENEFLKTYDNVHSVKFVKKDSKKYEGTDHRHCPYNIYLNELLKYTDDGWVIILDDDALLIDKHFLLNIAKECCKANKNDVIIYDMYVGQERFNSPINMKKQIKEGLKSGGVDMNGFAFHTSNTIRFDDKCAGDYHFLNNSKNAGYNLKYIKLPKIGVWANYKGWAHGSHQSCELPSSLKDEKWLN